MRPLRGTGGLRRAGAIAGVVSAIALASGCGYKLAGRNQLLPPEVKTIGIPPFGNSTRNAEISQRITEEVTRTFVSRGGYRTVPGKDGADVVLEGDVTGYAVNPVNVGPDGRATRYEVIVTARVELKALPTDKVYFRSDHFVFKSQYEVTRSAATFFNEEIVAIDEVSEDFAQSVVTSILEGF